MGRRKKPGSLLFASSSKLSRFAFLGGGASAILKKPAALPVTTAQSDAGDVQEGQSSPDPAGELVLSSDFLRVKDAPLLCAVEGSSSSAKTIPDPQLDKMQKPEVSVADLPPSGSAAPTLSARIQKSTLLQELGTPTAHVSGAPFVLIPDDNIESAKEEFKEFVFARFPGEVPPMGRIIGVVNAIWARSGPRIFVHKIGEGTYLLKVANERTRNDLLSRQVWMIKGCPMFIAAWSPEFTPEQPQLSSAVVPVEFRGVPYLLFSKQSLSRIATAVGKPVSLAPETERKENFEVAKVWVQVNLLTPLPDRIVSGFSNGREAEISVVYPWLPEKCNKCKKFGHSHNLCPSTGPYWRPIVPPPPRKPVSPSARSLSRESKGRKRSRPGRSARARRRDRSRGRDATIVESTGPSSPHSVLPSMVLDCKKVESSDALMIPKDSTDVPRLMNAVGSEEAAERSSEDNAAGDLSTEGTPSMQMVSLDRNLGSSTVHVYHKDDVSAEGSDKAEASDAPFFLVSHRKGGRKATKA